MHEIFTSSFLIPSKVNCTTEPITGDGLSDDDMTEDDITEDDMTEDDVIEDVITDATFVELTDDIRVEVGVVTTEDNDVETIGIVD